MVDGLIIPPGASRRLVTAAEEVTYKVTGAHARHTSTFEGVVPPGFEVGAHVHAHGEELFYVLRANWRCSPSNPGTAPPPTGAAGVRLQALADVIRTGAPGAAVAPPSRHRHAG